MSSKNVGNLVLVMLSQLIPSFVLSTYCTLPSWSHLTTFSVFLSVHSQKIGMPEVSVRNKMRMDGIDTKVIATFFGEKLPDEEDSGGGGKPMEPPCPKPDMTK